MDEWTDRKRNLLLTFLADLSTNSEPRNPSFNQLFAALKRGMADFKDLKLRNI